jgi:vitamin B12 transporter
LWTHDRASAFVTVGGRAGVADLEPNNASSTVTNPGYAIVSLGGSHALVRHLEVFGRVTNVLDRRYEEAFGYPALGRSASVGLRVAAGR